MAVVNLDTTLVSLALPLLQRDLGLTAAGGVGVLNAYLLALVLLTFAGGRWGDRVGARRAFVTGLLLMVVACLAVAGVPPSSTQWPWACRALQGAGAALCLPSATALLVAHGGGPAAQAKALGWVAFWGSVTFAVAPLLGGALVQGAGWRAVFVFNAAVCLAAAAMAVRVPRPMVLTAPTGPARSLPLTGQSARQARALHAAGFFINFGFFPTFLLVSLLMQGRWHASGLDSGWALLPLTVALPLGSLAAGRLIGRWGARRTLLASIGVATVGQLGLAAAVWADVAGMALNGALMLLGLGASVAVPALMAALLAVVPAAQAGAALGLLGTSRQAGGLAGVAVSGALAAAAVLGAEALGTACTVLVVAWWLAAGVVLATAGPSSQAVSLR